MNATGTAWAAMPAMIELCLITDFSVIRLTESLDYNRRGYCGVAPFCRQACERVVSFETAF
jgi:hypothetical protein